MLVFFFKQVLSLKKAILGRRQPHQLAWGLALGLLLGIVPHGNLIAMAILLFILSLGVNHGMVAVTAVLTAMVASRFDSQTHAVGKFLLTHPDVSPVFAAAWQWPVVPWTDINNTVVLGSLATGLAFVIPAYLVSYPIFHWLAPEPIDVPTDAPTPEASAVELPSTAQRPALRLHETDAVPPTRIEPAVGATQTAAGELPEATTMAIDAAFQQAAQAEELAEKTVVDTRIEVVRMYPAGGQAQQPTSADAALPLTELEKVARETSEQDPPMSEALNYLLRQLRDARQGRAA